jgi:hypothetical protein
MTDENFFDFFPTAIGVFPLGREFTNKEKEVVFGFESYKSFANSTSLSSSVLDSVGELKEFCQRKVDEYFAKVYAPREKVELKIGISWVNFSNKNESHHDHFHCNSLISGVLYIQSDEDVAPLVFERPETSLFYIPPKEQNRWNTKHSGIKAAEGFLILFPSHLRHKVGPNPNERARVSISFNTFPFGLIGDPSQKTDVIVAYKD